MTATDITPSVPENPTKTCSKCETEKPLDGFAPTACGNRRNECRVCIGEAHRLARANRADADADFSEKVIKKFWSRVDRTPGQGSKGDCWGYSGGPYGKDERGRFAVNYHSYLPYRVAFFLEYGHWPTPQANHRCDYGRCCRPDHLFEGTQKDNMQDMRAKGRGAKPKLGNGKGSRKNGGEKNANAKLSENNVRGMRAIYATRLFTQKQIALWFDISISEAKYIFSGERWPDIGGLPTPTTSVPSVA